MISFTTSALFRSTFRISVLMLFFACSTHTDSIPGGSICISDPNNINPSHKHLGIQSKAID